MAAGTSRRFRGPPSIDSLAGTVSMDLAFANWTDTDTETLFVVDQHGYGQSPAGPRNREKRGLSIGIQCW